MRNSQTDINNSIVRQYEKVRQSIELVNAVQQKRRQSQLGDSLRESQHLKKIHQEDGGLEENNKLRHNIEQIELEWATADAKNTMPDKIQDDEIVDATKLVGDLADLHIIGLSELKKRLYDTDLEKGHTQQKALELNLQLGDNELTPPKKIPLWIKFLKEISHGFAILLWIGACLSFLAYGMDESDPSNLYLGIIIIIVIFLTSIITFMQNAKSEALMESFKCLLPQECIVIRDGKEAKTATQKLVVGDIVKVKAGDKVPADIRILSSNGMKVDNSPFTGEVEPLLRTVECTNKNALETDNLAFFGTLCKEGLGTGVIINIGDKTMLGMISNLSQGEKPQKSPLRQELDRFVLFISIIAIALAILLFILAWQVSNYDMFFSLLLGIGILVANVPEGLLGSVTISLVITAKRLHEKNVLVKNLEAVETLGSTSCICTDKTGTLTQNVMTVEHMWYNQKVIRAINKSKIINSTQVEYDENDPCFQLLHTSAIISSEAKFDINKIADKSNIDWMQCPTTGDATETGFIRFFQYIQDIEKTRSQFVIPKNREGAQAKMPFNSTCKFALTIIEQKAENSEYCAYIKGAPEKIWTYCHNLQTSNKLTPINENIRKEFAAINLRFGKCGERVLGFAKLNLPRSEYPLGFDFKVANPSTFNFTLENFTFVGLISLIDPPKVTVPPSILECRSAGIKVIMVTGDQPPTATEIARQVNIIPRGIATVDEIAEEKGLEWLDAIPHSDAIVVHGDRIVECIQRKIDEDGNEDNKYFYLRQWIKKPYCVFARTTPAQKLQIVQACQSEGYICAVTGDGVNDSPAIKQGDIGISMNLSGSDVTKDAADMILLNDDFSSIVVGVEEGRKIFDNIKKTITYILTSNIPELIPFVAFIILRFPLAITNIYMICIDIGTDILPSLSLGYEEAEIDTMTRSPRKKTDHLVSNKVVFHAYCLMGLISIGGGFSSFYTTMNHFGFPIKSLFGLSTIDVYEPNLDYKNYQTLSDEIEQYSFTRKKHDDHLNVREVKSNDVNIQNNPYYNKYFMYLEGNTSCEQDLKMKDSNGNEPYSTKQIDWVIISEGKKDIRTMLVYCSSETGQWTSLIDWSYCDVESEKNKSPITDLTACYSTEALKYGQTSWFIAIVFFQWSNIYAVKSRRLSFVYTPNNKVMLAGLLVETLLCILISEVPGIQEVLGGRPLDFWQWGIPSFPFSILLLVWEETRKYLIRNFRWFEKYSLW